MEPTIDSEDVVRDTQASCGTIEVDPSQTCRVANRSVAHAMTNTIVG